MSWKPPSRTASGLGGSPKVKDVFGYSGMWCFKIRLFNPSPTSALGVKSLYLQLLRVNQLLCSNPTSSNTTSLNSQRLCQVLVLEVGVHDVVHEVVDRVGDVLDLFDQVVLSQPVALPEQQRFP